jgi:hypothetical protein
VARRVGVAGVAEAITVGVVLEWVEREGAIVKRLAIPQGRNAVEIRVLLAYIADAVAVEVLLHGVGKHRTIVGGGTIGVQLRDAIAVDVVIADVARAVAVQVGLARVAHEDAVIGHVGDAVAVRIAHACRIPAAGTIILDGCQFGLFRILQGPGSPDFPAGVVEAAAGDFGLAHVADAIRVAVRLVGIEGVRAVVGVIGEPVAVGVKRTAWRVDARQDVDDHGAGVAEAPVGFHDVDGEGVVAHVRGARGPDEDPTLVHGGPRGIADGGEDEPVVLGVGGKYAPYKRMAAQHVVLLGIR